MLTEKCSNPKLVIFMDYWILFQVWDSDIIESAMKTFYEKDLNVMVSAIEKNITVWFHLCFFYILIAVGNRSGWVIQVLLFHSFKHFL